MVARKAEAVGFESFWLPEHPIFPESFATRHHFSADGTIADHCWQIPDPFVGPSPLDCCGGTRRGGYHIPSFAW
jgi:alkanesulfonate monooxygenase SsuD/methylene tetrahydromethanopterin reductase-like flavin-dependent oxidoreductase (luciferase family)